MQCTWVSTRNMPEVSRTTCKASHMTHYNIKTLQG